MDSNLDTISIHSVYSLYEIESGGLVDTPVLIFERPQDWGNQSRWHYYWCRVEFLFDGKTYINNCHVYQEVERDTLSALRAIAPQLFMIGLPGSPPQLAGKSHLGEDDFWSPEWGKMPPYYLAESGD